MADAYAAPPPTTQPMDRPVGVTILAVLDFIGAALIALGGIMMFAGGAFFASLIPGLGGAAGGALLVVFGVLLLAIAAVFALAGYGLMNGKPWAWMLQIILSALSILNGIVSIIRGGFGSLLGIAISALIIWYFFTPPVKAFFGKSAVKTPWEKKTA